LKRSMKIMKLFNEDARACIYDISRLLILQIVTQFLLSFSDEKRNVFSVEFLQTVLFLSAGLLVYWLLVKKCLCRFLDFSPGATRSEISPMFAETS